MTADVELLEILRDIAAGRRNSAGDYWSRDYCDKAAAKIEALQMEIEALRAEVEKLRAALKLARDEIAGLPHSLGYAFTHLPAIDAALAQQPAACPKCDGTGEADSGGIHPWGAPATIPCDCQQPAADGYCVTREDGECVSSDLRCMHNKPAGEATMNSTMQQGPLEASLSDQLDPLPEQAGWCVSMHRHAAMFARSAERAVGLSCGATTPLFTADQMRAYAAQEVAAERERWQDAVMLELDSNGQAHAIVANATRA